MSGRGENIYACAQESLELINMNRKEHEGASAGCDDDCDRKAPLCALGAPMHG